MSTRLSTITGRLVLIFMNIILLFITAACLTKGSGWLALFFAGLIAAFNIVFLKNNLLPYRYLLPALITFFLFIIFPFLYTIGISFTNYGTGHVLSYDEARNMLLSQVYFPDGAEEFKAADAIKDGAKGIVLTDNKGKSFFVPYSVLKTEKTIDLDVIKPVNAKKYTISFTTADPSQISTLEKLIFKKSGKIYKFYDLGRIVEARPLYLPAPDGGVYLMPDKVYYRADKKAGFFIARDGSRLTPGFKTFIGADNYLRIFYNKKIRGPFMKIFIWTLIWAVGATLLSFIVGFSIATALNSKHLVFPNFWRVLIIIPYAIPVFLSALIWAGIFNESFGILNNLLEQLFKLHIPWLSHPIWAKVACLIVGTWIGFPYMMVITLGILQSIDPNLKEAARIDGASSLQIFRHITLPAIMSAVLPVLIGTFAFNFNNFGMIYLLNGGGPPMVGAQTVAGETDILISYTYKVAFEGGMGNDFGFAAAISIIIFIMVTAISLLNFKITGTLKEIEG